MSISPILATFLVCCSSFPLISSTSDRMPVEAVNAQLLLPAYTPVLQVELIAASTGKHLFRMPRAVSEDCVRTANVTYELASQPSTYETTKVLLFNAIRTLQQSQPTSNSDYAVELLCRRLNDEFATNADKLPDVQRLKKDVDLPRPAKDYYVDSLPKASVQEAMQYHMNEIDDPAFLRVIYADSFLNADTKVARVGVEMAATSKAIKVLAKRQAFESVVDGTFRRLLDDYVRDVYSQKTDMMTKVDIDCYPYLRTIDSNFLGNSALQAEYQKIKKETVDTIGQKQNQ